MKHVLVTGATGFVGQPLVAELAGAGYSVRAVVRRATPQISPVGVNIATEIDLARPVNWRPLLGGVDAIIHLAGLAHTTAPDAAFDRINRAATIELAEAAAQAGIGHLIFVSSVGAQTGPKASKTITENDTPIPSNAYGRSKLAAERAVAASGVPFTILRPTLIFGPGAKGSLRSLMRLAALPVPLPFGAFKNRRSLVSLADLIGAILFALDSRPAQSTYLVAHPRPVSLAEIIIAMRRGLGRNPGLVSIPPALFRITLEAVGKPDLWARLGGDLVVDPSRLIAVGWKPSSPMPESLSQLAASAAPRHGVRHA